MHRRPTFNSNLAETPFLLCFVSLVALLLIDWHTANTKELAQGVLGGVVNYHSTDRYHFPATMAHLGIEDRPLQIRSIHVHYPYDTSYRSCQTTP